MDTCYIFGAGEGLPEKFTKNEKDLLIAADAGIKKLTDYGVSPDMAVGDFDSLGFVPDCREIIRHPVRKDDTDTMLAVKTGLKKGYCKFVIFGGTGGRPDHTFANIQTLNYICAKGGTGFLCFDGFTACVIKNRSISFSVEATGDFSLFALSEQLSGVTIKNMLYNLDNSDISYEFPLGVSNSFTGKGAEITVSNGTALLIWRGKHTLLEL